MNLSEPIEFDLKAQFKLDNNQKPEFFEENEKGKTYRIYKINLIAAPPPTAPTPQSVTFVLDESYYQPVRKARRKGDQFTEEITSYGDFNIVTKFQAGDYITAKTAQLADLLKKGYAGAMNDAIEEAIQRIEQN